VTSSKSRMWRQFLRSPLALLGAVILTLFVLMAALAPFVAPYDPSESQLLYRLESPTLAAEDEAPFVFGTDHLGRDMLSRLIFGSRIALVVGFGGVVLSAFVGVSVGLVAGYFGGWYDTFSMRVVDMLVSIPNVLLYLTILGVFGPSLTLLILVIGLINWTTFARVVRGEVLAIKQREFVEAARASGQRPFPTLLKHVLPNILAPIVVIATLDVAAVIILEASLSFLGLGVQPPTVTWGRMLADGRDYVATAWWVATFPGIFITLLCLSLIFLGDWLRDVLDPRTS